MSCRNMKFSADSADCSSGAVFAGAVITSATSVDGGRPSASTLFRKSLSVMIPNTPPGSFTISELMRCSRIFAAACCTVMYGVASSTGRITSPTGTLDRSRLCPGWLKRDDRADVRNS